ncbi:MAG: Nudix family hydrolase [Pseudomonadota bacterium]
MSVGEGKRVEVAAAVIEAGDGRVLMASRPAGKAYAGWWEFPGGKVEPGETPRQALERELQEELGIQVSEAWPWLNRSFVYPHAHVMLRFFRVTGWQGEPRALEGQTLAWTPVQAPEVAPILPANGPILKGLSLPLEYAISAAGDLGEETFLARLEARLAQGLRFVQWRERGLAGQGADTRLLREVAGRCRAYGALFAINGQPESDRLNLARELGAGLHLPSAQLMTLDLRPDLEWVGASCHDAAELARATELELDWVVLGPVQPTASHPEATPMGWGAFARLIQDCPLPVYALGGLTAEDMAQARQAGAQGVALRSAAWQI